MGQRVCFLLIALAGAALDLVTKAWASGLKGRLPVDVIPGWLRWQYSENKGIVWGLFQGAGDYHLFTILSCAAVPVIVLIFWRAPRPGRIFTVALGLILAGTLGNLHDRVALGAVRDFIDFHVIDYPIFNVADSLICTGVGLLILEMFLSPAPKEKSGGGGGAAPQAAPADGAPPR